MDSSGKVRVLFISEDLAEGGQERQLYYLIKVLSQFNFKLFFASWIGTDSVLTFLTGSCPSHCFWVLQDHRASVRRNMDEIDLWGGILMQMDLFNGFRYTSH